jgi:hypothetical protein
MILDDLLPLVHEEIQRDMRVFMGSAATDTFYNIDDILFANIEPYGRRFTFNLMIEYTRPELQSVPLYEASLGLGNALYICFDKVTRKYSLEHASCEDSEPTKSFESADWNELKAALDAYFIRLGWAQ